MGYSLRIGELKVETKIDICGLDSGVYTYLTVENEKHPNAPAFGEPTDNRNERWPSYGGWADFVDFAGVGDLFYPDGRQFRGGHPGAFPIEDEFMTQLYQRYMDFKEKYPDAETNFETEENGALCRLEWLMYWCNWAHKNCKQPVFTNS